MLPDAFGLPLPPPESSNLSPPPRTSPTAHDSTPTPFSYRTRPVGTPLDYVSRAVVIGDSAVEISSSNSVGATGESENRAAGDVTHGHNSGPTPSGSGLGSQSAKDPRPNSPHQADRQALIGRHTSPRGEVEEPSTQPDRHCQKSAPEPTASPHSIYHFPSVPSASSTTYQSPDSINNQQSSVGYNFPASFRARASTAASSATSDSYSTPSSGSEQFSSSFNKSASVSYSRNTSGAIGDGSFDEVAGAAVFEVGLGMHLESQRGSTAEGDDQGAFGQGRRYANLVTDEPTHQRDQLGGDEDSDPRSTGKAEICGPFVKGSDSRLDIASVSHEGKRTKESSVVCTSVRSGTGVTSSVMASVLSPMSPLVAPFSPTLSLGVKTANETSVNVLAGEPSIWGGGNKVCVLRLSGGQSKLTHAI